MSGLAAPLRTATPVPDFRKAAARAAARLARAFRPAAPGARHDDEVEGVAVRETLLDVERSRENRRDLVPRRLLELRHQLEIGLLGGLSGQHLDFCGFSHAREQQCARGDDSCGLHDPPRYCGTTPSRPTLIRLASNVPSGFLVAPSPGTRAPALRSPLPPTS